MTKKYFNYILNTLSCILNIIDFFLITLWRQVNCYRVENIRYTRCHMFLFITTYIKVINKLIIKRNLCAYLYLKIQ